MRRARAQVIGGTALRLLIAASVGAGTGLVAYLVIFEVTEYETVSSITGMVAGVTIGAVCVVQPIHASATPRVLLAALVLFPFGAAALGWFYDSIPVVADLHLGWQWGYIAIFAIPAAATAATAGGSGVPPSTTVRLALTSAAFTVPWLIVILVLWFTVVSGASWPTLD